MKPRATSKARKSAAPKPSQAESPPARGNTYLYGIVRWPVPKGLEPLGTGVGDPPRGVRAVRHRELAALVSDVWAAEMSGQGVRGLRRDMKGHSTVLQRAAGAATVLPVRFGVVLPHDRALIEHFLEPQYKKLQAYLDHVEGAAEVTLRATYEEGQVLQEVVRERPELGGGAHGGRPGSMAYQGRIELGKQIAAAIADFQERDARWLIDVLEPVVRDVRVNPPLTDLMLLNASFLVERAKLPQFDRRLEKVNAEVGHRMKFDCVGPLPPFSFVDLKL